MMVYLSLIVFGLGVIGVLIHHQDFLRILISIELIILAGNMNWIAHANNESALFVVFALAAAAAEVAVGLAILILWHRTTQDAEIAPMILRG